MGTFDEYYRTRVSCALDDCRSSLARLDALRVPPGNQFKALKGANAGIYQVRVNDQYQIRFTFREEHFYGVCCKDFHDD